MKNIKIAYIGGGSKLWARVFMYDLALTEGMCGEIALYDIDRPASERNAMIGERINADKRTISKWKYTVCDKLEEALKGADFVACSILPATFDEMASDVHLPEKYGIYQSVGDTVGPGGVLRAMRTVPIYEYFASEIKRVCPNAWVINFTNPMTICTKTLYDVFPEVKAFGCCHEVFHAQEFLSCVVKEELGVPRPDRHEITIDASGVNHFTWITEANWKGHDILALLPKFIDKYYDRGYGEQLGHAPDDFKSDPFLYGNKVKMDLFRRYGVLAAAGDRHLVEFCNSDWYLKDPKTVDKWLFHLTTVDYRKKQQAEKIKESELMAHGKKPVEVVHSDEEATLLMQAVLGNGKVVSNVNMPNRGQMPDMPLGMVVETNCVFDADSVKPVTANKLPPAVTNLVYRNGMNIETCYHGIKMRNLEEIFASFVNQPLCSKLSVDEAYSLFKEMVEATKPYLKDYYDLKKL
ncbi:MAG: alpha-glucosidase/alpha-galactosidase [Clostridia bacterium]|nr:alpha-glucosidase/alpha-galactosidase [Clostridia bacterium]